MIIDTKTPDKALPEWIKKYRVKEIYLQHEWTEEEKKEEKAVLAQIDSNIIWNRYYEQFLFHPSDLPFSRPQIPEIFGTFRKVCEKKVQLRPSFPSPASLGTSNLIEINHKVPTLADLGLPTLENDPRSAFPFLGGTTAALERLEEYFWKNKK